MYEFQSCKFEESELFHEQYIIIVWEFSQKNKNNIQFTDLIYTVIKNITTIITVVCYTHVM